MEFEEFMRQITAPLTPKTASDDDVKLMITVTALDRTAADLYRARKSLDDVAGSTRKIGAAYSRLWSAKNRQPPKT